MAHSQVVVISLHEKSPARQRKAFFSSVPWGSKARWLKTAPTNLYRHHPPLEKKNGVSWWLIKPPKMK